MTLLGWLWAGLCEIFTYTMTNKKDDTEPTPPVAPELPQVETPPADPLPAPKPPTAQNPAPSSLLETFLAEIQAMEGWYRGSTSFTCKNPGNLRCTLGQEANWNRLALGTSGGFCVFKDEATGMLALRNVTVAVCKGQSTIYNSAAKHFGLQSGADLTLGQYFVIRDPASDGNNPTALAMRFATKLGVNIATFHMKDLLS